MTPVCESTMSVGFRNIVTTTARESGDSTSPAGGADVFEVLRRILHYDVRTIGNASQGWFWSDGWRSREREASEDIEAGRTTIFRSSSALLDHLDAAD